jgi:hypothetical protein
MFGLMVQNGTEWNETKWNGVEWSGMEQICHSIVWEVKRMEQVITCFLIHL